MIFRSEDMSLLELRLTIESGWYFMKNIGNTGYIQISQSSEGGNHTYQNKFDSCKTLLSALNEIEVIIKASGLTIEISNHDISDIKIKTDYLENSPLFKEYLDHTGLEKINEFISKKYLTIKEIDDNLFKIEKNLTLLIENACIVNSLKDSLPHNVKYKSFDSNELEVKVEGFGFYYICGLVSVNDIFMLQRSIFRSTKENVFLQIFDLRVDKLNLPYEPNSKKIVFVIFQGGQSQTMKTKVQNIFKSFNVGIFTLPDSYEHIEEAIEIKNKEITQMQDLYNQSKNQLVESLKYFTETEIVVGISKIELFKNFVYREKSINKELSKFQINNRILTALAWVPTELKSSFKNEVNQLKREFEIIKADIIDIDISNQKQSPPTYYKLNDLTKPPQLIVDTYGIPRYKEVNPALFTISTFPYLFGVMFGDVGHGLILFMVGLFLIRFYDQLKIRGLGSLLTFRYLLTMMGFFSFFCGLVYNDFLGIPLKLFSTCYKRVDKTFQRIDESCTYTLGFDSVWYMATEEVGFMNSFKMKLSIIVGVVHMTVGIFMKGANSIYFSNYKDFIFEFIPQLLFLSTTFGYMCVTIIIKWLKNWGNGEFAPSIISIFINLGSTSPESVLWGESSGDQQTFFQQNLFKIAFICFWVMLLPKPIILSIQQSRKKKDYKKISSTVTPVELSGEEPLLINEKGSSDHEEDHDIGEIFVHQMIEVIEFVLGSISNTASYLRLWALSLAHGQLAKVFLELTVLNSIKGGSAIASVIGFPIFVASTVMVLMLMDLMECFLHTLRLHWVEFQNKFFKGDGSKFVGFNIYEEIQNEYTSQP